jgi:hypothetical protein
MSPPQLTMPVVNGGVTDNGQWRRRLDPTIGLRELRWFRGNVRQLTGHQRQWIAILGQQIVAFGDSLANVRDRLAQQGIRDALVVRIPENLERREYFIG